MKIHNLRKHRLYYTWINMMSRCYNKSYKYYKNYGALGIKVCDRWHNIENFISDMYPTFKEGLTLDKDIKCRELKIFPYIYSKDTCLWIEKNINSRATKKIHIHNTSGFRGVCYDKQTKKYKSQISVNNKNINLGRFNDALNAAKAYDKYVIDNNLEHTINFNKDNK